MDSMKSPLAAVLTMIHVAGGAVTKSTEGGDLGGWVYQQNIGL